LTGAGALEVWDTARGCSRQRLVGAPAGNLHAVAASPCSRVAAVVVQDSQRNTTLAAWDLSLLDPTGERHLAPTQQIALESPPGVVKLSRRGKYFASFSPRADNVVICGALSDGFSPATVSGARPSSLGDRPLARLLGLGLRV